MNIWQILVFKKGHFQRHKMINIKTGQLYSQSKNILYISDFLCSTANFKRERSKHFLESLYKYIYRLFPSRLRLWSRVRYSKGSSFCSVGDINKPAVFVRGIALIQFLFSILVAITWEKWENRNSQRRIAKTVNANGSRKLLCTLKNRS